jgi:hypothetical protein
MLKLLISGDLSVCNSKGYKQLFVIFFFFYVQVGINFFCSPMNFREKLIR